MVFTKKDVPQIKAKTPEAVGDWLLELQAADLLWHMDDSPLDIITFDRVLARKLLKLQREAWTICRNIDGGIWGLPVWKIIFDNMNKGLQVLGKLNAAYGAGWRAGKAEPRIQYIRGNANRHGLKAIVPPVNPFKMWQLLRYIEWENGLHQGQMDKLNNISERN